MIQKIETIEEMMLLLSTIETLVEKIVDDVQDTPNKTAKDTAMCLLWLCGGLNNFCIEEFVIKHGKEYLHFYIEDEEAVKDAYEVLEARKKIRAKSGVQNA
jgi:hypothetical protein